MAQPRRATPGMIVNLLNLPEGMPGDKTLALMKTESMEAIRIVLPKDKEIPVHAVPREISVYCLKGKTNFSVDGEPRILSEGDWMFLSGGQSHALHAYEDSVLLVTIILEST